MEPIKLKKTDFQSELVVSEDDLKWETKEHPFYKMLVSLHHIPSGEKITQATNIGISEGKKFCLRELQVRLCTIPKEERFCEWCHKKMEEGGYKAKYCGDACRNSARENRKGRKKNNEER
ncbi:MAG: hypothetical protein CMC15_13295 [Flavobacteriaceae bacterium]|nr:hypothetical protein [Flavobacteriaceae bacterium]|tara:strand:- start:1214 stop:1573 length:360 start_codon:yes stop_codon:yes gene_type:complete